MGQQKIVINNHQLKKYFLTYQNEIAQYTKRYQAKNLYIDKCAEERKNLIGDIFYILDESRTNASKEQLWFDCIYNWYRHLKRLPRSTAHEVADLLLSNEEELTKQGDFDSLYNIIRRLIVDAHIAKVGEVAWYDITLRIGLILHNTIILPDKQLYLHADVKTAAKAILGKEKRTQMSYRTDITDYQELFVGMESAYIEDFLCILQRQYISDNLKITGPYTFIRQRNPNFSITWENSLSLKALIAERYKK